MKHVLVLVASLATVTTSARHINLEDQVVVPGPEAFNSHWGEAWKVGRQLAQEEGVDFHGIQPGSVLYNHLQNLAASRNLAPAAVDYADDDPERGLHTMLPAPGVETEVEALGFLECGATCTPEEKARSNSTSLSVAQVNKQLFVARAIELKEKISTGALAKVGALNAPAALKSYDVVANPEGSDWEVLAQESRKRENGLRGGFLKWAVGVQGIEEEQRNLVENKTLWEISVNETETRKADLKVWLESKLGKLGFVEHTTNGVFDSHLTALEDLPRDELVVEAPMLTALCRISSVRINTKRSGYLDDALKKIFKENDAWGVAIVFLHEYFKDLNFKKGSKWGPFVRSLKMKDFSSAMSYELTGTYASSMIRKWNSETNILKKKLEDKDGPCRHTNDVCAREPNGAHFKYEDIQWALWIVRQHAIRVTKKTTKETFLAIVPYAHLLQHDANAGGTASFDIDGSIRVHTGQEYESGQVIRFNFGNLSDSETLLRFHYLAPNGEEQLLDIQNECFSDEHLGGAPINDTKLASICTGNPNNTILIKLPGVGYGSEEHGLADRVAELNYWRDQMKLPPRMSDLHRAAKELKLLGENGKESILINNYNKLLAGLPASLEDVTMEDQLMMIGKARNVKQLRELLTSEETDPDSIDQFAVLHDEDDEEEDNDDDDIPKPQLYPAPDVEDDPHARTWMERLSNLLLKVKESIEAGAGDPNVPGDLGSNATRAVINESNAFIQHGALPSAGLDELDLLLMKKMYLLKSCGERENMVLTYDGVSPGLMCAMRVHFMNETEIDVFCPSDAKWYDRKCTSMYVAFNATEFPISYSSEAATLKAILELVRGLLSAFPHTLREDVELLQQHAEGINTLSPLHESIVRLRAREKWLFESVRSRVAFQYRELMKIGDTGPVWSSDELQNNTSAETNTTTRFQIHQYAMNRREIDLKEARLKAIFDRAKKEMRDGQNIATLTINIKAPNGTEVPTNITLQSGNSIVQVTQAFISKHGLPAEAYDPIVNGLKANLKNVAPLELIVPVITVDGRRRLLGMRHGQTPKEAAELFCARWTATLTPSGLDKTLETVDQVAEYVEERWNITMKKRILAQVPIESPDGRLHQLVVREGVHHDLVHWLIDWCSLHDLGRDIALQIVQAVKPRLPTAIINIPVQIAGRRTIVLTLLEGSDIEETVDHFCEMFDLHDKQLKVNMRRALYSGMSPGSMVLN